MIRPLLAAVPLLFVGGCAASDTAYPSLSPRAIEKQGFDEPTAAVTAMAPDPALDGKIAELDARLQRIGEAFGKAASAAERKGNAARGRPPGSDPWLEAQTALAALDDWRAQASALSTDVEQLAITRAATLLPPYPALTALGDRTESEAKGQGETIARIQGMLAPA